MVIFKDLTLFEWRINCICKLTSEKKDNDPLCNFTNSFYRLHYDS